jgi:hypothetical protein
MSRDPAAAAAPHLPAVDRVLGWAPVAALAALHGRSAVLEAVRAELAALRALAPDERIYTDPAAAPAAEIEAILAFRMAAGVAPRFP